MGKSLQVNVTLSRNRRWADVNTLWSPGAETNSAPQTIGATENNIISVAVTQPA